MHEADDAMDIITLVGVLALFVPIMIVCAIPFYKGDVGGFGVQIEKTALETNREIVPEPFEITTDHVMLMLVIADKFTPEPRAIRLNTYGSPTLIHIDDHFLLERIGMLIQARSALPFDQPIQFDLYSGPSGMRFWDVYP